MLMDALKLSIESEPLLLVAAPVLIACVAWCYFQDDASYILLWRSTPRLPVLVWLFTGLTLKMFIKNFGSLLKILHYKIVLLVPEKRIAGGMIWVMNIEGYKLKKALEWRKVIKKSTGCWFLKNYYSHLRRERCLWCYVRSHATNICFR